jgi:hypothetical protein
MSDSAVWLAEHVLPTQPILKRPSLQFDSYLTSTFTVGAALRFGRLRLLLDQNLCDTSDETNLEVANALRDARHAGTSNAFVEIDDKQLIIEMTRNQNANARIADKLQDLAKIFVRVRPVEHLACFLAKLPAAVLKNDRRAAPKHLFDVTRRKVTENPEDQYWNVATQNRSVGLSDVLDETH